MNTPLDMTPAEISGPELARRIGCSKGIAWQWINYQKIPSRICQETQSRLVDWPKILQHPIVAKHAVKNGSLVASSPLAIASNAAAQEVAPILENKHVPVTNAIPENGDDDLADAELAEAARHHLAKMYARHAISYRAIQHPTGEATLLWMALELFGVLQSEAIGL